MKTQGMMKKGLILILSIAMIFAFAACGGNDTGSTSDDQKSYTVDAEATTLTIAGDGQDIVYTADDLKAMDLATNTYSGRNKKVENARQFETYTGVELNALLKDAGYDPEGAILTVTCSDGYTREYEAEELYGLYTYANNETDEKTEVAPIIAVLDPDADAEYPSPFRLIYGQEDYDSNDQQDFNMQGWASYLQYIQVSYE